MSAINFFGKLNVDMVYDISFSLMCWLEKLVLVVGLVTGLPEFWIFLGEANATNIAPALPYVSVLISGPPIKGSWGIVEVCICLFSISLIREIQKPLEDITKSLKIQSP
ncbi:peptidyl-prolyl cis-trans isomerase [Striga asiatica]|uniref:Peptidyl-prolyl cis-trans isomerase n=1 Tax=Striga asiatica TaxID=4170 RepID=A0A5A7Q5Z6_STRAF|nr:peptidyl-prolyl cis-trans isomerase [Striga asiatica]